jgi:hypothetical protein
VINEAENLKYARRWLPAEEGAPLLGYSKLDAFYRDCREGHLPPDYWQRHGRRIFVSALALGLVSAPGGADPTETRTASATA